MSTKKALIIDANSQIGSFLFNYLELNGTEVYGTTRRRELITQSNKYIYLDLLSDGEIKNI